MSVTYHEPELIPFCRVLRCPRETEPQSIWLEQATPPSLQPPWPLAE